jgi:hypothetical protein
MYISLRNEYDANILSYNGGGATPDEALKKAHDYFDDFINRHPPRLTVELIERRLGLDHDDAVKVHESSCVTQQEYAEDREACWTRLRGAAEELCDHQFEPGVDEDGNLLEPPKDVCIHCGEERY